MIAIKSLLVSAFALLTTASPLLPRDAAPADSITYCSTPADTICSAYDSAAVVVLPKGWSGHFECYVTVDGVDRYYAGHPPIAPDAALSKACFANSTSLAAVPGGSGHQLCLKSQLAECCAWSASNGLAIEGLQCAKVAGSS